MYITTSYNLCSIFIHNTEGSSYYPFCALTYTHTCYERCARVCDWDDYGYQVICIGAIVWDITRSSLVTLQ